MEAIQQLYEQNVRSRPAWERLQLATLILNDIPPQAVADYSETWTDEDAQDFRRASRAHISRRLEAIEENEVNAHDAEQIAAYCKSVLDLEVAELSAGFGYACLPLCVIDAVYSIGVRYEGVRNVLARYREHLQQLGIEENKHTLAEFVQIMQEHGLENCADHLFGNRQRTSVRSGILKAEAVHRFAAILHERGISSREEAAALANDTAFEQAIFAIPGQKSGISLKYFFMLCGSTDYIKPDRMVFRFLEDALGRRVKPHEPMPLLQQAARLLQSQYSDMTPAALDHEIWKYQRAH